MASIFDVMRQVASENGKNLMQQEQRRKLAGEANRMETEAPFLPEYFRARNENEMAEAPYKRAQTDLTRGNISRIPSQIQKDLAEAAYQRAQTGRIPFLNQRDAREFKYPDLQSTFGKAVRDQQVIKEIFGENSPQYKNITAQMEVMNQGKNGIQIYDPKTGEMTMSIGGNSGRGSGRNNAGALRYNPETKEAFSTPSTQVVTRVQRALLASKGVQDSLKKIVKGYEPYLGARGTAALVADTAMAWFTGNHNAVLSAWRESEALGVTSAEQLMAEMQLNTTDQSAKMALATIKPRRFENAEDFKARIFNKLVEMKARDVARQEVLAKGIPLRQEQTQESGGPTPYDYMVEDLHS